jgi:hypothetical protein
MRALAALISTIALFGCDYHRPLGTSLKPQPLGPLPGAGTGSGGSGGTPDLTWNPASDADSYEVQVDDSCRIGIPCDFPSPEIDVFVTDPYYVPVTPLTVPSSGPRRQTYCWRVRGCHQSTCGDWSDPRCFVVGADKTLNRDLNGDGYADFVVGAPRYNTQGTEDGRVGVFVGGAKLPERPALVVPGQAYLHVGQSVATVGDVNGDGYGDYLVSNGGDLNNLNGNGTPAAVRVYFGGPTLKVQPDVVLTQPDQYYEVYAATGCGDLNGDGYDDLAFTVDNIWQSLGQRIEVHFGGPDLATSAPLILQAGDAGGNLVQAVPAGDVNGDGYADLLVSYVPPSGNAVGAMIFYGGPAMDVLPDVVIPWPDPPAGTYTAVAGLGDVNGDGFADVALGVPRETSSSDQVGLVRVFFGGEPPHTTADLMLAEDFAGDAFGTVILPAGDLNQDGYADFAVLSTGTQYPVTGSDGHSHTTMTHSGQVLLFAGGPVPASTPFAAVSAPSDHPYVFRAAIVDLDGDGVAEILVSESSEIGSTTTASSQVAIYGAGDNYAKPVRVLPGFKVGDNFGIALSQ